MDLSYLSNTLFEELGLVARSGPNERLPKEELTRCIVYRALRSEFQTVAVERGFGPVDEGVRSECDLWASAPDQPQVFMEIKHAWSAVSLNNRPSEQFASWLGDLGKLEGAPLDSERYFLLVGFFGGDPLGELNAPSRSVLANIQRFQPSRLIHRASAPFTWRKERITHVAVWIWRWFPGMEIVPLAS